MFTLAAILVFLSLVLVGYAVAGVMRNREESTQTIRDRLHTASGWAGGDTPSSLLKDERLSTIDVLNAFLQRLALTARLVRMIRQAGLSKRVGEIVLHIPLLACVGVLAGLLLTSNPLVSATIGVFAGALPLIVVQRRRHKRMRMFSDQLPDALDLLRAALQSGHSLVTGFLVVADEFPDPIGEEFRTVAEETRLGLPMRDALYNL